ncbi:hypothetical protein D9611_010091 [Ephemerocybe angulata]|uniref:Uncharacterized protein n=1 Tax=Ephemerocybe angulata TaxID=980116 RepID=A0A8H5B0H2_9AGAR|nr:hypothetical protein D9611_010091 [Tulosesus angulatus]
MCTIVVPAAGNGGREFKVTVWRTMNSVVLMGFGTTKAVLAFRGNPSADAFDVALGLIWALIAYWCGIIENECPNIAPWLFEVDMKEPLVSVMTMVLEENTFMILLFVAVGIDGGDASFQTLFRSMDGGTSCAMFEQWMIAPVDESSVRAFTAWRHGGGGIASILRSGIRLEEAMGRAIRSLWQKLGAWMGHYIWRRAGDTPEGGDVELTDRVRVAV